MKIPYFPRPVAIAGLVALLAACGGGVAFALSHDDDPSDATATAAVSAPAASRGTSPAPEPSASLHATPDVSTTPSPPQVADPSTTGTPTPTPEAPSAPAPAPAAPPAARPEPAPAAAPEPAAPPAEPAPAPAPAPVQRALSGTVLVSQGINAVMTNGCGGYGRFAAFQNGTAVTITDAAGTVIGTGQLSGCLWQDAGSMFGMPGQPNYQYYDALFNYSVTVPEGAGAYATRIGWQPWSAIGEDALRAQGWTEHLVVE